MRASIYCRISRDREGAGLGVATQEADCRALAESLGASVAHVFTDNDLSAYSGKPRPGYESLLAAIANGQTDSVLTWHTDRLHRSPAELEDYIALCESAGVRTVTVKAGVVDLASPSGLVMARTLGAFARYEVDHARERMQRAKQRSAESGRWKGGRRPFGFEPDGVTVREDEAQLIRDAIDNVLAGASIHSIARSWNAAGVTTTTGRPWPLAGPRRVLLRPRNAGLMEHRGEIVGEAEWPALVEVEKWRAATRILTDPARRTSTGSNVVAHLGSNLFRCGICRAGMRVDRDRQKKRVYRCPNGSHVTRLVSEVDAFVSGVVVERLRQPDLADLLLTPQQVPDVRLLESRARELEVRRNQLADLFADGTVTAEQLATGSRRLTRELEDLQAQISGIYDATSLADIAAAPDPGAAWQQAPLERQRLVLAALLAVTLKPSARGRPAGWSPGQSYFRPESVEIMWVGAS